MNKIRLDGHMTELNRFNYYWNGAVLMSVVSKKGNRCWEMLDVVPKKYWINIFTTPSVVSSAKVTPSIPSKVYSSSIDLGVGVFIDVSKKFHE